MAHQAGAQNYRARQGQQGRTIPMLSKGGIRGISRDHEEGGVQCSAFEMARQRCSTTIKHLASYQRGVGLGAKGIAITVAQALP